MDAKNMEIRISEQTATLVRLRKMTDNLWDEIVKYLETYEDEELPDRKKGEFSEMLFERDFEQSLGRIQDKLREYLDNSITMNILSKDELITI